MYFLNNKNCLCKKNYSKKKKTDGETRVNNFKCIFRISEDIMSAIYYRKTTLKTSQKLLSWTGYRNIKHLYKTTTNEMW